MDVGPVEGAGGRSGGNLDGIGVAGVGRVVAALDGDMLDAQVGGPNLQFLGLQRDPAPRCRLTRYGDVVGIQGDVRLEPNAARHLEGDHAVGRFDRVAQRTGAGVVQVGDPDDALADTGCHGRCETDRALEWGRDGLDRRRGRRFLWRRRTVVDRHRAFPLPDGAANRVDYVDFECFGSLDHRVRQRTEAG